MDQKLKDQRKKIVNQLSKNPRNIRFKDFQKLVSTLYFQLDRINGSHHIYFRPGEGRLSLQPDKNGKAKPYQIKQLLILVDDLDLLRRE